MANVVLVHGAWCDGSSWAAVISGLHDAGHRVVAVQNPTTTLDADIAAAQEGIDSFGGDPVVLAGHSYGGTIISAAASGREDVTGLVYVAALGNDEGESVLDFIGTYPPTDVLGAIVADDEGWSTVDRDKFPEIFAADVARPQAQVMAAVQQRLGPTCFGTALPAAPAWRSTPSWYLLSENDRVVHPDAQAAIAERMSATTVRLPASHASLVSRPDAVVEAITAAAG